MARPRKIPYEAAASVEGQGGTPPLASPGISSSADYDLTAGLSPYDFEDTPPDESQQQQEAAAQAQEPPAQVFPRDEIEALGKDISNLEKIRQEKIKLRDELLEKEYKKREAAAKTVSPLKDMDIISAALHRENKIDSGGIISRRLAQQIGQLKSAIEKAK